ncbi:heterokaryon incompatibility protein-domain-containing protein, partial [Boeremia exigua]|uniref:heterokaryon incompatibility protein-domain-containing protein n=1 Tax=Boeremia exigua TaxID=749465 RepID=UPI001E8D9F65
MATPSKEPTTLLGFVYEPLQSLSSIRVLDLLPSLNQASTIKCSVRQVVLGNANARYDALSYVWGARKGNLPILCNDQELFVTPNCRDALIRLRQRLGIRTIWVDAICIDQSETPTATTERNRQVQMMGEIYRRAQQVVVWLGHGDGNRSRRIWQSLRLLATARLAEVVLDDLPLSLRNAFRHITKSVSRVVETKGLKYLERDSDPIYDDFLKILENSWFFRVWTTQEIAFARRCTVVCGTSSMDWTGFTVAIKRAHALHHSTTNTRMISFKDNMRDDVRNRDIEDEQSSDYSRMYDIQLLKSMCKLQCSVPSDKVYGLYSILEARGTPMPEPDYSRPSIEVLEEFAKAYTRSRGQLDVLRITLPATEARGLPSWLPDWFEGIAVSELTCSDVTGTCIVWFDDFPSGISACREASASRELSPAFGKLRVRGRFVGSLTRCIAAVPIGSVDVDDFPRFEDFLQTCQDWCSAFASVKTYPTGEDPSLAAIRTIGSHRSYGGLNLSREDLTLWYERMLQRRDDQMVLDQDSPSRTRDTVNLSNSGDSSNPKEPGQSYDNSRMQKVQRFVNYKANYASFILDSGYFGTAYNTCQTGDGIYLLAGLGVPCVLRAVDEEFRFVALAYVHGAMRGELWPDDTCELRDMVLM